MAKRRVQPPKAADENAEWWVKRRLAMKLELSKDRALQKDVTVMLGRSGAPGSFTIEVYHSDFPMPLAVAWFTFCGLDIIQVNNLYTFEDMRRCGLMRFLVDSMLKWYPKKRLVTAAGTELGKAFMLATGWVQTDSGFERAQK